MRVPGFAFCDDELQIASLIGNTQAISKARTKEFKTVEKSSMCSCFGTNTIKHRLQLYFWMASKNHLNSAQLKAYMNQFKTIEGHVGARLPIRARTQKKLR